MSYIPELYRFLRELQANNNRAWFATQRERYEPLRQAWLADLQRLIDEMAQWEPTLRGVPAQRCAYRIYRDTRFSPDKTPYKDFFSATLSRRDKTVHQGAAFYLQMGPGRFDQEIESGMYAGMWQAPGEELRKLRRAIVDNIDELEAILNEPQMRRMFPGWVGAALKTVPQGYPKDHPLAPLLRLKDYGKFLPASEQWFADPDWPQRTAEVYRILNPLVRFINYSINEE